MDYLRSSVCQWTVVWHHHLGRPFRVQRRPQAAFLGGRSSSAPSCGWKVTLTGLLGANWEKWWIFMQHVLGWRWPGILERGVGGICARFQDFLQTHLPIWHIIWVWAQGGSMGVWVDSIRGGATMMCNEQKSSTCSPLWTLGKLSCLVHTIMADTTFGLKSMWGKSLRGGS